MHQVVLYMEVIKKFLDEEQNTDHPISLYAATKKSNELLAHSYSHLYGIPCTGQGFLQFMALGEARYGTYDIR